MPKMLKSYNDSPPAGTERDKHAGINNTTAREKHATGTNSTMRHTTKTKSVGNLGAKGHP